MSLSDALSQAAVNCAGRLNEIIALYADTTPDQKGLRLLPRIVNTLDVTNNTKRILVEESNTNDRENPKDLVRKLIRRYANLIDRLARFLEQKSFINDNNRRSVERTLIIERIQAFIDSKTLETSVVNDGSITGPLNKVYWYMLEAYICARYLKLRYEYLLFKLKNAEFGDLALEIEQRFADYQGSKVNDDLAWSANSESSIPYIAYIVQNPTATKFDFKGFQTANPGFDIFTIADSS